MTPFSILDLSPIAEGGTAAESFRNTLDIAQHGERWGYKRYWMAEHHGMPGIASAAKGGFRRRTPIIGSGGGDRQGRSEEHTSELQSLMRISYAVFCLKQKKKQHRNTQ